MPIQNSNPREKINIDGGRSGVGVDELVVWITATGVASDAMEPSGAGVSEGSMVVLESTTLVISNTTAVGVVVGRVAPATLEITSFSGRGTAEIIPTNKKVIQSKHTNLVIFLIK